MFKHFIAAVLISFVAADIMTLTSTSSCDEIQQKLESAGKAYCNSLKDPLIKRSGDSTLQCVQGHIKNVQNIKCVKAAPGPGVTISGDLPGQAVFNYFT